MQNLDPIADNIREHFERIEGARDLAYQRSRQLTSLCAKTIRAIHREEWETATKMLNEAKQAAQTLGWDVKEYPPLYHAGYTQDALKEYVEATLLYAMVRDQPLPTPEDLDVEYATYLNGLAEAATELRRRILDIIRRDQAEEAETLLDKMKSVYGVLITFDFNDSVTGGLRRRTDTVRAVLERTLGDVTTSVRQTRLEQALSSLESKLLG